MDNDVGNFVANLACEAIKRQGIHFDSQKEAERYQKKVAESIQTQMSEANFAITNGLTLLSGRGQSFVASRCKELLDNIGSVKEVTRIIQKIYRNDRALELFSEDVNQFYDCGDYGSEESVIAVFLLLFPMHPQSYACFATLLWRRDGIQAAQNFYEQIVDEFKEPLMDYFAAQCLFIAGEQRRAEELLCRANQNAQESAAQYAELFPLIQGLARHHSITIN